jgi:hypothetical protein
VLERRRLCRRHARATQLGVSPEDAERQDFAPDSPRGNAICRIDAAEVAFVAVFLAGTVRVGFFQRQIFSKRAAVASIRTLPLPPAAEPSAVIGDPKGGRNFARLLHIRRTLGQPPGDGLESEQTPRPRRSQATAR